MGDLQESPLRLMAPRFLMTAAPEVLTSATSGPNGIIMRISPDGKIDPKPVVTGLVGPAGMAIAP
jgi:hypothetical protein